jgi:squalene-hopene/tetraprenyl-beta-curcumene cyclase
MRPPGRIPALITAIGLSVPALAQEPARLLGGSGPDLSLRQEVRRAIDRGTRWLHAQQRPDGSWSDPDHPALTALALIACLPQPGATNRAEPSDPIQKGYGHLLRCVQPDGGIYRTGYLNYNTSVSVLALVQARRSEYEPVIRRARAFIIGQQNDLGEQGKPDTPYDGGIGYGGSAPHADLSNTMLALEALYHSRRLDEPGLQELDWTAAIRFIERCQNLPGVNPEPWASDDPSNRGGFVYFPGKSMAGGVTLPSGRVALRSYGSMSYAGLLSYIYADLRRDDPRVTAVVEWIQRNFTVDDNPGLGAEGLYYYFHTLAKALTVQGVDRLQTAGGEEINWRPALAKKLFNLQHADGHWVNQNGRWWEKDPVLVTAYAVIALRFVERGL